jgi:glycosyltransferase involved in cell wall biosynthesis
LKEVKPRLLWIGNLRGTGGISVITQRFLADPQTGQRFRVRVQDQGFSGAWNEFLPLKLYKLPRGLALVVWNLLAFRPQLVHIHTAYREGFLRDGLMALIAGRFGARVVISFHPGFKDNGCGTLQGIYRHGPEWLRRITRLVVPRLDAVIASGPSYAAFLREELQAGQVIVLPNPVSDGSLPPFRDDYQGRGPVVFFAGTLDRRKGVFELLQAAERVPKAQFIIYGTAVRRRDRADFEAAYAACRARDRIHLDIGYGVGKVFEYMQQARLLALPSWGESLPLVLEEALLCGLPVAVTPVGVIADYIQDGVHGCLVQPGDVEGLAAAIRRVLADPAWAEEVSRRNRLFGRQFLSSQVHPRLFAIYDQVLE